MKTVIEIEDSTDGGVLFKIDTFGTEDTEQMSDTLYHTVLFKAILKGHLPQAYAAFEANQDEIIDTMIEENTQEVLDNLDGEEVELDA